jgi:hypothetical protein
MKSKARTAATAFCSIMGTIFALAMEQRYNAAGNLIVSISTFPVWFLFGSILTAIPVAIIALRWEEKQVIKQNGEWIDEWVKRYADR